MLFPVKVKHQDSMENGKRLMCPRKNDTEKGEVLVDVFTKTLLFTLKAGQQQAVSVANRIVNSHVARSTV